MKTRNLVAWGFAPLLFAAAALAAAAAPPNLEATLKAQRKLVDAHPKDSVAHNDLGNLLEEAGDLEAAEAAYQKAIELDPQAVAAHFNLALLYQSEKKDRKAAKSLENLLEIDPRHAWAHYQLGVLYEKKGRRNAAIEQYAQAFAIDTGLSFARNNPQIIDSWLATEGLLRAEHYLKTSEDKVPRQFNDAARIRKMMLAPPQESTATKAATPEDAAKAAPATPPEEGSRTYPAGTAGSGSSAGTSSSAGSSAGASNAAADSGNRVITNEDLRGSSASNSRSGSRPRQGSPVTSTPRGSSTFAAPAQSFGTPVQKGAPNPAPAQPGSTGVYVPQPYDPLARPTGGQPNVPPTAGQPARPTVTPPVGNQVPPDRFRPGRRSTASLEWQLEPTDGNGATAG